MTFDVNKLWKSSIDGHVDDMYYDNALVAYWIEDELVHWEPKEEYRDMDLRPA
jgi:hypothetical protein